MSSIINEPWLQAILTEGDAYLVGGPVRDKLLDRQTSDLDILVARLPAARLEDILNAHGSVHLVGKSFGVFKFTPTDQPTIDIALPRRERSTGSGHKDFDIQADPNIPVADDLGRRDFTINAMARDLRTGELVDPHNGQIDLKAKRLRQVFDKTFIEDPLRMLRGFQFAARLGFIFETATFSAIQTNAKLVTTVSPERIFEELNKLLQADKPSIGFELMHETGLLTLILPELTATIGVKQPEEYHKHPVFEHILAVIDAASSSNLAVRWAALGHDLGKPPSESVHKDDGRPTFHGHEKHSERLIQDILGRLRAPDKFRQRVAAIVREHMFVPEDNLSDKALRRLINRVGPENVHDLALLRQADRIGNGMGRGLDEYDKLKTRIDSELSGKNRAFDRRDLAVDGKILMTEFGLKPGPQLGKVIDQLFEAVLDDPSLNERSKLIELAKELLQ